MLRHPQLQMLRPSHSDVWLPTSNVFSQAQDIDIDCFSAISDIFFFHIPLPVANNVGTPWRSPQTISIHAYSLLHLSALGCSLAPSKCSTSIWQAQNQGFTDQEWPPTNARWDLRNKYQFLHPSVAQHCLSEGPYWVNPSCPQWQRPLLVFLENTSQTIFLCPNPCFWFWWEPKLSHLQSTCLVPKQVIRKQSQNIHRARDTSSRLLSTHWKFAEAHGMGTCSSRNEDHQDDKNLWRHFIFYYHPS